MGWVDAYPKILAELTRKRGQYAPNIPRLTKADMVGTLAQYSTSLANALSTVADRIARSEFATASGVFIPLGAIASANTLTPQTYLSECVAPNKTTPWKRTPSKLTDDQLIKLAGLSPSGTYEPVRDPTILRNEQTELIGFLRGAVADYQRALDQIAYAVSFYPLQTTAPQDTCKLFLSSVRALGSDLDVLGENPPTTFGQDVRGALAASTDASAKALETVGNAAGRAAGFVGNAVGNVAGSALSGFFDKANLVTLAVAGVVGYVAFKRFV